MAYEEKLAARVRKVLIGNKAITEIKMFGGLCFTLRGNMCCGVLKNDLILRMAPEIAVKYLGEPHVRPMDFTGIPMKGFIYVGPDGTKTDVSLKKWLQRAVKFSGSLPRKKKD